MNEEHIHATWVAAGGDFHGPIVETATIPKNALRVFVDGLFASLAVDGDDGVADAMHEAFAKCPSNWFVEKMRAALGVARAADYQRMRDEWSKLVITVYDHADAVVKWEKMTVQGPGKIGVWLFASFQREKVAELEAKLATAEFFASNHTAQLTAANERVEECAARTKAAEVKAIDLERYMNEARRDVAIMRGYADWDAMVRAGQGCNEEWARQYGEQVLMRAKSPDANVEALRARLLQRSEFGLKKYGVTTDQSGLGLVDWLKHMRDEMLDGAVYATAALEDLEKGP